AAAISSSVSLVPERTIRPSASLISLNSPSFGILDFTTTVNPAFSRSSTPCFERLSLTRIFMRTYLFPHQDFLSLCHTAAEFYRMAETLEHHFSGGHRRNHIEPGGIAPMRKAEKFPLQIILSTGCSTV